jgi:hypothetical protein
MPRPTVPARVYVLSVLPAFLLALLITFGTGAWGWNEIVVFLVSVPVLAAVWFYLAGMLLERVGRRGLVAREGGAG